MAADIEGFSRLMGADEDGTVARVTAQLRELAGPVVEAHGGRIFKTMGDGFLAIFDSPLDALRSALAFQESVAKENAGMPERPALNYRIGINLGDVLLAQDDVYGDTVNIAARLQTLAEPGGVCISGSVHDQIKKRIACQYRSLGEERLKNIADPVPVFRVLPNSVPSAGVGAVRARWLAALAVIAIVAPALAWLSWGLHAAGGSPGEGAGGQGGMTQPDTTQPLSHDEMIFRRMMAILSQNRFAWRTVERLAIEVGVTEAEAHAILAAHPEKVALGKSKDGKLIVRLA